MQSTGSLCTKQPFFPSVFCYYDSTIECYNAPRPSEHPPQGKNVKTFRLDDIGSKYKTSSSWHLNGFPYYGVVTLGHQYNIGEKPTVILYTYINRHAGTPQKQQKQKHSSTSSNKHVSNNILLHRLWRQSHYMVFNRVPRWLLFLTFSVLVANPKKLLYTVANPVRGLLNREKKTKEKVWQHTPLPTPHTARSEKNKKHATHLQALRRSRLVSRPYKDTFGSSTRPMDVASQNSTLLPSAITSFPVSLLLSSPVYV